MRWVIRGVTALLTMIVLGWIVFGAPSLVGAVLAALSLGAVGFVLAELSGQWPVSRSRR